MTSRTLRLQATVAVGVATGIGVLLAWQGWQSRLMNFDYINFIAAADRLLQDGAWPDRGDVSSYWAFSTPGPSLLMVPGMLVFDDPRLYESIASVVLYIGTVFGLFLVARQCFGLTCACLSAAVYALSRNGLFYAGSIYPIGHPFFFVWMAYCCLKWVQGNDGRYLAVAVTVWGIGMYVDMVLAPALFMVPAVWLLYRPRVSVAALAVAGLVVATVWFPYLRFQQTRDFADLKSLVSRHSLQPADYTKGWCAPSLVVQQVGEPTRLVEAQRGVPPGALLTEGSAERSRFGTFAAFVRLRSATIRDGMTFDFDQLTWTPLLASPLFLLTVATLVFIAFDRAASLTPAVEWRWLQWLKPAGWTLLALSVVTNEVFIARYLSSTGTLAGVTLMAIRTLQAVVAVCGLALVLGYRRIDACVRQLGTRLRAEQDDRPRQSADVLAIALAVPWLILVMLVEPGAANRYLWLGPLQMLFLVAAVIYVPQRFRWSGSATRAAQVLLTVLLLTHPWLRAPIEAWSAHGWSGVQSTDLQALDFIARQLRSEDRTEAAIGYHTLAAGFMARQNAVDPRYKIGGELDLYLKQRHGIANTTRCAEGVSPQDEYRIVQDRPQKLVAASLPGSWVPLGGEVKRHMLTEYFDVPLDRDFRFTQRFGEFQVFRRPRLARQVDVPARE